MHITSRDIEIFKLLNRYRYLRRTFLHALLAAPLDSGRLRHRIYALAKAKYLREPEQQKQSANYRYTPRVYELGFKGKEVLAENGITVHDWEGEEFWHDLMVADVVASIELACKHRGLKFRDRWDILGRRPLELPTADHYVRPDYLFSINDTHFALEADRKTEPINGLKRNSSWAKKIQNYADVFANRRYHQWGIPSMLVLNITTSPQRATNIKNYIEKQLGKRSRSLCFRGVRILGSRDAAPKPLLSLLDDPWERAGHPPFVVGKEV